MPTYKPDDNIKINVGDSQYYKRPYSNPYVFNIAGPRNEDEKKVKLVVVVSDLSAWLKSGLITLDDINHEAQSGKIEGNYSAFAYFTDLPNKNPKTGENLLDKPSDSFLVSRLPGERNAEFTSGTLERVKKEPDFKVGPNGDVEDLLNFYLIQSAFQYKKVVYNLQFQNGPNGEVDANATIKYFNLPENKVEFTQNPQDPPMDPAQVDTTKNQSNAIIQTVLTRGDFKFNVETVDQFLLVGSSSVYRKLTEEEQVAFENRNLSDELDEEYVENIEILQNDNILVLQTTVEYSGADAAKKLAEEKEKNGGQLPDTAVDAEVKLEAVDASKKTQGNGLRSSSVSVVVDGKSPDKNLSNPMDSTETKQAVHWTHRVGNWLVSQKNGGPASFSDRDFPPGTKFRTLAYGTGNFYGYCVKESNGRMVSYCTTAGYARPWFGHIKAPNGKLIKDNCDSGEYYIQHDFTVKINGKNQPVESRAPFQGTVAYVSPAWGVTGLKGTGPDEGKIAIFFHQVSESFKTFNQNWPSNAAVYKREMNLLIGKTFNKGDWIGTYQGNISEEPGGSKGVHLHIEGMSKTEFDQYVKDCLLGGWWK